MILSRLHSSAHALGDEIQDSYQRRDKNQRRYREIRKGVHGITENTWAHYRQSIPKRTGIVDEILAGSFVIRHSIAFLRDPEGGSSDFNAFLTSVA
jgi:hypothetical protein